MSSPERRAFVAGLLATGLADAATALPGLHWQGPRRRGSGWLEWRLPVPLVAAPEAVFDPAAVDLWCELHGPGGRRLRVTGFWTRDEAGEAWCLRLLPPVPGRWRGVPQLRLGGAAVQPAGAPFECTVEQVPARQRIGIDPRDARHFAFDDGTPFVPVGLNVCWSTSDDVLADYRRWFTRLAAAGGNFARLWMASWSFGIEWKDTPLGDYRARLHRAALLDAVFELAESLGIQLMLCLLNHGAFTEKNDSEWRDNPYNAANGGPLRAPEDFVTDARAQRLFERRLRYIAARWSMSPALHSWEWWNEITWTPIDNAALRPWIARMDRVLAAHDPYRRLRSTSWADRGDRASWQMPELDFAQQHDYTQRDLLTHYGEAAAAWAADGIGPRPLVPGELGLETTHDAKRPRLVDGDAVHLHNGLWAPLFRGFASTALYWWWDQVVDPQDLWPQYRGVARWLQALQARGLGLRGHHPHPAAAGGQADALALAGPRSLLLWVRARRLDVATLRREWQDATGGDTTRAWRPDFPPLAGVTVRLAGLALASGSLDLQWFDAGDGRPVAGGAAAVRDGALELDCPAFTRDLALIATLR